MFSSLRFRLIFAAALSLLFALLLAGWGLIALFELHVERHFDEELKTHLRHIIGGIKIGEDGYIQLQAELADPRFSEPLSGLYWQIQDETQHSLLRSRSLWDQLLALPSDELSVGDVHFHQLDGPDGQILMVEERQIILRPNSEARHLRVAVALDRAELLAARQGFADDMWPYLGLLALFLMLASILQVTIGLSPMTKVRNGIVAIRSGQLQRLHGDYPDEVLPLVDEINELLDASEAAVGKAKEWTADLAHGLKTPLTALSADAQRLRQQGNQQTADELEQLIDAMQMRLDRELVRARLRSRAAGNIHKTSDSADLHKALNGIVKTLQRTPTGRQLDWYLHVPETLPAVAIDQADLTELLGNLLENASKWATQQVQLKVQLSEAVLLTIEDDGIGVDEQEYSKLGQRGLRLDEGIAGHGLGLAIARDICEAYDIELVYSPSALGGLKISLHIPAFSSTNC